MNSFSLITAQRRGRVEAVRGSRITLLTLVLAALAVLLSQPAHAQDLRQDSLRAKATDKLTLNFLIDGYYGYDFARREASQSRQPFYYNSNAHNTFSVNLAMLDAVYTGARVRGRVALGFGTYFEANYAAEPQGLRNLFETSVGVKLSASRDIWLDVGVLPSPYGYEGAISLDQLTYTRSLSAENSPYYLSGARLGFVLGEQWTLNLFVLNGWQNIVETNGSKSLGTQLQFKPKEGVLINWSTYAGDERTAAGANRFASNRYFSDLYAYWKASSRLELLALFDIGLQQYDADSVAEDNAVWTTANAIARYSLSDTWALGARIEYFSDPNGVIIGAQRAGLTGFTAYGGSLNLDYSPAANVRLRLEHRTLLSDGDQFADRAGNGTNLNHFITLSLSARF